jgi:hypothetical protein
MKDDEINEKMKLWNCTHVIAKCSFTNGTFRNIQVFLKKVVILKSTFDGNFWLLKTQLDEYNILVKYLWRR